MDKTKQIETILNFAIVAFLLSFGVWVVPILLPHSSPEITNVELLANVKVLFYQLVVFNVGLNTLVRELLQPLVNAIAKRWSNS